MQSSSNTPPAASRPQPPPTRHRKTPPSYRMPQPADRCNNHAVTPREQKGPRLLPSKVVLVTQWVVAQNALAPRRPTTVSHLHRHTDLKSMPASVFLKPKKIISRHQSHVVGCSALRSDSFRGDELKLLATSPNCSTIHPQRHFMLCSGKLVLLLLCCAGRLILPSTGLFVLLHRPHWGYFILL